MTSILRYLWGLLFRIFPCPTQTGLRRIGTPMRDSPVLVTCNFDLTLRRLRRALRGIDAWLLVADSKGVNVWCASGAHELNARTVVAVIKTSGIGDLVDHRTLVLPQLAGPGVRAQAIEKQTGWTVAWGPVRMTDIPRYLEHGIDAPMRRASWSLFERLDTALGSLFPFLLCGALGFALFGRGLLVDYVVVAALAFVGFFTIIPWVPGRLGLARALVVDLVLGGGLLLTELTLHNPAPRPRADWIIAMVLVLLYGGEVGGIASNLKSDLDPFMARLGMKKIGNVAFAGTIRTDLLNGWRRLVLDPTRCERCGACQAVCPQGVWLTPADSVARLVNEDACTGCTACLRQCHGAAIRAHRVDETAAGGRSAL
ncbi:MAG: 4Fe-4S dicluster domain-containing protein [Oligoflexia bacterium]|nr:4Fe-4S dicluster domain-containing protein [Oligoflexia bacterium]